MSPIAALTGSAAGTAARMSVDHRRRRRAQRALRRVLDVDDVGARRRGLARLAGVDDAHEEPHDSLHARAAIVEGHELHAALVADGPPCGPRARARPPRCRRARRPPAPTSSGRRPPPRAQQRLDERAGARVEAPALHLGERVADELLDARERAAELLEVVLDQRRQQRRQHQLRDLRRALGRRHEPPERLLLGGPDSPGSARGTTSTTRHSSGIGWCASSGAGRSTSRRTPPSTTRPPSANVHVPTAERARAADRLGQLRRVDRAIVERRQRLRDRERELRARAQPDVRRDRLDHAQVRAAREARAPPAAAGEASARSASAPSAEARRPAAPRRRRRADRSTLRARRSAAGRRRRRRASRGAGAPAPRRAPRVTGRPTAARRWSVT